MITGQTPGHHGVFDFIHCRQTSGGVYFTLNMSYDIRCPTLWTILSRQGIRVATFNFPVSYPPERVNGVCVSGFMHWRHLRQSVHPPAFYDRIRSLPGFDAKLLSMDMNHEFQSIQFLPPDEYEPWINYHIQREGQWFDLVRLVLENNAPDLTAVVFDGVDKLQHLCWRLLDPALCPNAPTPWETRCRELCLAYFRRLDEFIQQIVGMAGPEARVFLASDHGFGPTQTVFFANAWLARQGYFFWAGEAEAVALARIADGQIKDLIAGIDWDRTLAFALNPSSNGIYIRRADGSGSSGVRAENYQAFRARLADDLLSLIDPHSGSRFFRQVLTREEAFPGQASARAPDLTLLMQDYGFLSVLKSDAVFRRRPEPWGTHYPAGIFIAAGPGVEAQGKLPRLDIVDVAPVLLRSLGLPPEPGMHGCCPEGLFDARMVPAVCREVPKPSANPEHENGPVQGARSRADLEVHAEVLKRLEQLNYL
jgi:predicted AlkP superfamily phosphohydrolase/phosphomutase